MSNQLFKALHDEILNAIEYYRGTEHGKVVEGIGDAFLATLAAHEAAKPAEPWGYANRRDGQAWSRVVLEGWHAHNMARYDLPLYAAPVAVASPLTADQIEAMPVWKHFIGLMPEHRLEFTRAIEAHHGIKEQA